MYPTDLNGRITALIYGSSEQGQINFDSSGVWDFLIAVLYANTSHAYVCVGVASLDLINNLDSSF